MIGLIWYTHNLLYIFIYFLLFSPGGVPAGGIGGDYVSVVNQTLTINATTSSFGYQLLDDDEVENVTETFQLVLSTGAGASVNVSAVGSIATISITDDDGKLLLNVAGKV